MEVMSSITGNGDIKDDRGRIGNDTTGPNGLNNSISGTSSGTGQVTPKRSEGLPISSNYSTSNSSLSSYSTHQTTNPTSSSSTNLNPPSTTKKQTFSKHFKSIQADYKKLNSEISKFNNKSGILKTNHLRLILLSFLRLQSDNIYTTVPKVYAYKPAVSGIKVLVKWWQAILQALSDKKKTIPASQKSVYFECVSRLICRYEWNFINDLETESKIEDSNMFIILLTKTLDYSINQLNLKNHSSLSISAFIGKVFAISFFHLKGVPNALLFLLNVRISSVLNNYEQYFNHSLNYSRLKLLCHDQEGIKSRFPTNIQDMIQLDKLTYGMKLDQINLSKVKLNFNKGIIQGTTQSNGLDIMKRRASLDVPPPPLPLASRTRQTRHNIKFNFNAVPPPAAPVKGITDPQGPWVKKWSSFNSDVFISFLRHYLSLSSEFIVNSNFEDPEHNLIDINCLVVCPGFNVIWSHLSDIISWTIKNCTAKTKKSSHPKFNPSATDNNFNTSNNMTLNFFNISTGCKNIPLHAIAKIFQVLRDFLYNPKSTGEKTLARSVIKNFDNLMIGFAKDISAYDYLTAGYVIDLVQEFITQVCCCENDQEEWFSRCQTFSSYLNWKFWLNAIQNMLMTENINSQLKALAFLFNVWQFIPNENREFEDYSTSSEIFNISCNWFKNPSYSIKYNFTLWLTSSKNWLKFFCHWQALVRSYYLRLIVWRVLSKNKQGIDFQYSSSSLYSQNGIYFNASKGTKASDGYVNNEKIKKIVTDRLNLSYEKLVKISQFSSLGYYLMPDMSGSSPIANRKFSITPINFKPTNENLFIDPNVNHINNAYQQVFNGGSGPNSESNSPTEDDAKESDIDMFNGLVPAIIPQNSNLRKMNPFEIFDDSAYSSNLPSDDNDGELNPLTSSNTVKHEAAKLNCEQAVTVTPIKSSGNPNSKLFGFAFKLFKKPISSSSLKEESESQDLFESRRSSSSTNLKENPLIGMRNKEQSETSLALLKKSRSVRSKATFTFGSGESKSTDNPKLAQENSNSMTSLKTESTAISSMMSPTISNTSSESLDSSETKNKTSIKSFTNFTNNRNKKRSGGNLGHTLSSTSLKSMSSSNNPRPNLESVHSPPEFQNKVPEIQRQLFKFSLVWNDESLNYQLYVINNSSFNKFYNPSSYINFSANSKFPHYPTLPFSESMGIGYMPAEEEYSTDLDTDDEQLQPQSSEDKNGLISMINTFHATELNQLETGRKPSDDTFYSCDTNGSPIKTSPTSIVEKEFKKVTPVVKNKAQNVTLLESRCANNTLRKWKTVGKSLNEWNDIVKEYEDFIRSRKQSLENQKLLSLSRDCDAPFNEENYVPLLIAEAPAPKVNAS